MGWWGILCLPQLYYSSLSSLPLAIAASLRLLPGFLFSLSSALKCSPRCICLLHLSRGMLLPRDAEPGLLCTPQPVLFFPCIFLLDPKFPETRNFQCVFSPALHTVPGSQCSVSVTDSVDVDRMLQDLEMSLTWQWQSNRKCNHSSSEDDDHSIATVKPSRRHRGDDSETLSLELFTWKI